MENLHYCYYQKNPVPLSYLHLACGSIRLIKIVRRMGNMLSYLLAYGRTQPGGLTSQPGSQPVTIPDKWGVLASRRASGRKNNC